MEVEFIRSVNELESNDEESCESGDDEEEGEAMFGGFEQEFIDEVLNSQKCAVCLLPMRDAVQTAECGHRFCSACLKRSLRTNNSTCPNCRDPIDASDGFYRDNAWSRDILSLRVKCNMSSRGCDWTGEVRHAEDHQLECSFADVTCGMCAVDFQRRNQQVHLTERCSYRVVECTFCKGHLHFFIKPEHEDEYCTRFPLACKNHCGSTDIPREEMELHLSEQCPMTEVACPYMEEGCVFEDKRAYLNEHIEASTEDHMQLLLTSLVDAKRKLSKVPELEEKLKNLEEKNEVLKESEAKKSKEAARLALTVKELEVNKMKTDAVLHRLIVQMRDMELEFKTHKKETDLLKKEIPTTKRRLELRGLRYSEGSNCAVPPLEDYSYDPKPLSIARNRGHFEPAYICQR